MENNERKYIGDICYIQLNSGGVLTRIADGMSIKLSATEYKILSYFIANKNQDLSLEQIADFIWEYGHEKDSESIKSHITHIRKKLDQVQPGLGKKCIITNRGFNTYTMKIDSDFAMSLSAGAGKGNSAELAQQSGAKPKDVDTYVRTNISPKQPIYQDPEGRYLSTVVELETIQRLKCDTAPPTYLLPKAPGPSESFIEGSRDTEIDSTIRNLEINKPVFLWGCGGIGKSEIAIKAAQEFENHSPKGAYFIHYTVPFDKAQEAMEETVLRMPLSGFIHEPESGMSPEEQRKAEYKKRIRILTEQYAGALLVIDNFDWLGKTLDDLRSEQSYQEITSIGLNLLFTTRNEVPGTPEVKELSREDLLKLMRWWCTDPRITDQQLLDLIEAVDGHTLTVDIIAKTLSRSRRKITPEMMLECLKSSKLSEVKYPKVTLDTVKKGQGVDRVQHREQKSAQIYEHLKALFDLSGLDEQMKIILCCAILLPAGGMDCQLFESCLEEGQIDAFDYLLDCGWLKNSEDNVLTIHPVIRTVCEEELPNAYDSSKLFLNKLYSYAEINANYDYSDLKESEMRTSRLFQIIMAYKRALLQTKALGDSESVTTLNQQYNDLIFIYGQLVIATRGFGVKRSAENYSVCYTVNESENIHYSVFIISEYAEYPSLKKNIRIDPVPSSIEKDGASWKRNFYIPRTTYDKQNVISLMYQSDTNTMYIELAELFDNMFIQKTILTPIEVGTFKSSDTTYRVINILGDSEGVLEWSVAEEGSMHELGKKIQVVKLPEMNSSVCSIGDICLQTPYFCFTVMYKESQMASNTMVANCYANGCDGFPQNTDLAYRYYNRAVSNHEIYELYDSGLKFYHGRDFIVNTSLAMHLFRLAAELGHKTAMEILITDSNDAETKMKASRMLGINYLGAYPDNPFFDSIDPQQALVYLEKAKELGADDVDALITKACTMLDQH